jgi:DNA-binding CsgD family transcriptional regulator
LGGKGRWEYLPAIYERYQKLPSGPQPEKQRRPRRGRGVSYQQETVAVLTAVGRRKREVMALVVCGLLNKQVGGELGISEITVKAHRGKVMRKMKADSLAELVKMAARSSRLAQDQATYMPDTVPPVNRFRRNLSRDLLTNHGFDIVLALFDMRSGDLLSFLFLGVT